MISLNDTFEQHIKRHLDGDQPNICVCIATIAPYKTLARCGLFRFCKTFQGLEASEQQLTLIFCKVWRCSLFWKWLSSLSILPCACLSCYACSASWERKQRCYGTLLGWLGSCWCPWNLHSWHLWQVLCRFPILFHSSVSRLRYNSFLLADKWRWFPLCLLWSHLACV